MATSNDNEGLKNVDKAVERLSQTLRRIGINSKEELKQFMKENTPTVDDDKPLKKDNK